MVQVNGLHGFGLVLVQQPQACRVGDRQGEDDSARLGVSPGHDRFHDLILLGTAGHNEDHFLLVDEVHAQETGGTLHAGAFGVVAMVAMTPLITVQLMGLIAELKTRKARKAQPAFALAAAYAELPDDAIIEL